MEKENQNLKIVNLLMPEISNLLDKYAQFDNFFKKITKITFIEDCEIEAKDDKFKNNATENGHYLNQNLLIFYYANREIYFDLIEGVILSDEYRYVPDTGCPRDLFKRREDVIQKNYNQEDLEKLQMFANAQGGLKNLQFIYKTRSVEDFKKALIDDFKVYFDDDNNEVYILMDDPAAKIYLNVNFEEKLADFNGLASLQKDGDWQKPFNIEEELAKIIEQPEILESGEENE